ncbi:MAG: glycosyltransferase involved in cell wall biosynthesis [Candidatus Poriferisodalaceae bacterium]|jgi:glycosyltransferase involved in cell wall biosynthesis
MKRIVALVPAKDRADTVGATVRALVDVEGLHEVLVIDDGSSDATGDIAKAAGASVLRLDINVGKGGAVAAGVAASGAAFIYLLIDADLGDTACHAGRLLAPVLNNEVDMTIAVLPSAGTSAGFGLVKRAAAHVLATATKRRFREPLSGQRAIGGALLRSMNLAPRFGLEVGLTIDAVERDMRIREIDVAFSHRATGRSPAGFLHRAKQGSDLARAAAARIGWAATRKAVWASIRREPLPAAEL